MNIRDTRTVGEQVKSGFRIAGLILLTFMLVVVPLRRRAHHSNSHAMGQVAE